MSKAIQNYPICIETEKHSLYLGEKTIKSSPEVTKILQLALENFKAVIQEGVLGETDIQS